MSEQQELFAWIDFVKDNVEQADGSELELLDFFDAWSVEHETQSLSYNLGFDWLSIDMRHDRVHLTLCGSSNDTRHLGEFNSIMDAQIAAFIFINQ